MKALVSLFFWYPFRIFIQLFPPSLSLYLAGLIGRASLGFRSGTREIYIRLLKKLFPDKDLADLEKLAKEAAATGFKERIEFFYYPKYRRDNFIKRSSIQGLENLEEALSKGKGCILLCAHYGFNQGIMPILGFRGIKINQLAARPHTWHEMVNKSIGWHERLVMGLRDRYEHSLPADFLYIGGFMRPALEVLKRGEILIMAYDGRAGSKWLEVPIGNLILNISGGPENLMQHTGCEILPVFVQRNGSRYVLEIGKPLNRENPLEEFGEILKDYVMKSPDSYIPLLTESLRRAELDNMPLIKNWREI